MINLETFNLNNLLSFEKPMKQHQKIRLFFSFFFFLIGSISFLKADFSLTASFGESLLDAYENNKEFNDYLSEMYSPDFKWDPYGEVVKRQNLLRVERVAKTLSAMQRSYDSHHCNITLEEISEVLYGYSSTYRAEVSLGLAKDTKKQTKRGTFNQRLQVCEKYLQCMNLPDFNTCVYDIVSDFDALYVSSIQNQQIETNNMAKERYRNNSVEDSPYDLFYDISAIHKVIYESLDPDEPPILFYDAPSAYKAKKNKNQNQNTDSSQNQSTSNNQSSQNSQNSSSASKTSSLSSNGKNSQSKSVSSKSSQNGGDSAQKKSSSEKSSDSASHNSQDWAGTNRVKTDFGGNKCTTIPLEDDSWEANEEVISDEWDEAPMDQWDGESETPLTFDPLTTTLPPVHNDLSSLFPSSDWNGTNPDAWNNPTNPDEPNDRQVEKAIEEIKTCVESCKQYTFSSRVQCEAQCMCNKFESEFYTHRADDLEKVWFELGPLLTLNFCTVPAMNYTEPQKWGKMYSIEEIFNEIKNVILKLWDSWELWVHEKQTEVIDSSVNMNLAKSMSFMMNSYETTVKGEKVDVSKVIGYKNFEKLKKNNNRYLVVQSSDLQNTSYLDTASSTDTSTVVLWSHLTGALENSRVLVNKQIDAETTEAKLIQNRFMEDSVKEIDATIDAMDDFFATMLDLFVNFNKTS